MAQKNIIHKIIAGRWRMIYSPKRALVNFITYIGYFQVFFYRKRPVYTIAKGAGRDDFLSYRIGENVVLGNMGDSLTGMLLVNILYLV